MKQLLTLLLAVMMLMSGIALAEGSWVCPTCGRENSENFCTKDGTARTKATWTCPTCGHENSNEDDFCGNDGTPKPRTMKNNMPSVGDYVTFGCYGGENIEWLVLEVDKKANTALLVSKYGLEAKPYNRERQSVTWETSTLRKWLNEEFYNNAFSVEEQTKIVTTKVTADHNPMYETTAGNDTDDKVWLLSIKEYFAFFAYTAQECMPTIHAVKNGAYQSESNSVYGGACWWWLRSPGMHSDFATVVPPSGTVLTSGLNVSLAEGCVRPVIVLQLS